MPGHCRCGFPGSFRRDCPGKVHHDALNGRDWSLAFGGARQGQHPMLSALAVDNAVEESPLPSARTDFVEQFEDGFAVVRMLVGR